MQCCRLLHKLLRVGAGWHLCPLSGLPPKHHRRKARGAAAREGDRSRPDGDLAPAPPLRPRWGFLFGLGRRRRPATTFPDKEKRRPGIGENHKREFVFFRFHLYFFLTKIEAFKAGRPVVRRWRAISKKIGYHRVSRRLVNANTVVGDNPPSQPAARLRTLSKAGTLYSIAQHPTVLFPPTTRQ